MNENYFVAVPSGEVKDMNENYFVAVPSGEDWEQLSTTMTLSAARKYLRKVAKKENAVILMKVEPDPYQEVS